MVSFIAATNRPLIFWGQNTDFLFPVFFVSGVFVLLIALLSYSVARMRRAQTALRKNEEGYRSLAENIQDYIIRFDRHLRHVYINSSALKSSGHPREHFIGKTYREIGFSEDLCQVLERGFQRTFNHAESYREIFEVNKPAGKRILEWHFIPEFSKAGNVETALVVVHDISAIRQGEEALRQSEQQFRQLAESIPEVFWLGSSDWKQIFYISPAYRQIWGRPCEAVYQNPNDWFEAIVPEDRPAIQKVIPTSVQPDQVIYFPDYRIRRPDGTQRWVSARAFPVCDESGKVSRVAGLAEDITNRKHAEEILGKWDQVFKNSEWGILVTSADGAKIEIMNPAFARMHDYSMAELAGQPVSILFPPQARDNLLAANSLAQKFGHHVWESLHMRKDGSTFPVQMDVTAVKDENGRALYRVVNVQDISERRKAEAALESERKFLRQVIDRIPAFIAIKDESGHFILANETIAQALGTTPSGLEGKTDADFSPTPEQIEGYLRDDLEVARSMRMKVIPEEQVRFADGSTHWMTTVKVPIVTGEATTANILLVSIDITQRKQAEEELRKAEQKFRLVSEHSKDVIFAYDMKRHLIYVSPALYTFTGYDPEELYQKDFINWLHPEDEKRMLSLWEGLYQGKSFSNIETRIITKDGQEKWCLSSWEPLYDEEGRQVGVQGSERDITERKRTIEEKEHLQNQLLQAQKMESIGRLAGGVAHDFNNLLGVILGHTENLIDKNGPASAFEHDLQEILQAAQRSASLTRQLLAFARKQTTNPKVLDLNETVAGSLQMLRRLIGENIDLVWAEDAELWPVKIDPMQVDQILANLLVNAHDAISEVGRVIVETKNTSIDEAYCAQNSDALPGKYVCLSVSDSGCGMSPETMAHLFEPFFTTKETGKGTGLGLATIYGIVKQNQGFINVYSEPGQGTTFKIYLPYSTEAVENEPALPTPKTDLPEERRGCETILIVEDEEALLELGVETLAQLGYEVIAANTPGQAIEKALAYPGTIRLLITDVIMPEMNGHDLAGRLAAIRPDLKCLFMSGYTADIITHQGVLNEGVHFIQKPFTLQSLADKVRDILD